MEQLSRRNLSFKLVRFGDFVVDDSSRTAHGSFVAWGSATPSLIDAVGFHLRPEEQLPFFVRASSTSVHKRLTSTDRVTVRISEGAGAKLE